MKILMIHPHDLFSRKEPWTIRIKSIAQGLAREGHSVRLCYFPSDILDAVENDMVESVELHPLDRRVSPVAFLRNTRILIELAKWADVVHFQKCHYYASLPAVAAAFVNRKPLHYDWDDWEEKIHFESTSLTLGARLAGYIYRTLEKRLPALADTVSVASWHLRDMAYQCGKKKEDVFSAPVGADLEDFPLSRNGKEYIRERYGIDETIVLYIGQLHGAQYVDVLIDAANVVLHKKPQTRFMVVGSGFLERTLRDRTRFLGIDRKFIFTGSVGHDEIPAFIAAADICVAAFKETDVTKCKSPLKIVEYLAGGKAIVASDVGEVHTMLAGVGILVKPGDAHALADGIIEFLSNETLRRDAGILARKRAESRYQWQHTVRNIVKAYEKALSRYE